MDNERGLGIVTMLPPKDLVERRSISHKAVSFVKCLGPAFIISVAYIDPGNFATNISGGSKFNYSLMWVILCSNLMAIFLQVMSAKLGIATGHNLPEMCGKVFSRRANWIFWIVAELGAMITNLAEFLGATLGLYLLFNIPMIYAGFISGVITFFICHMEKYGQRVIEKIISALVAVICAAYSIELFITKPDWNQACIHMIMPSLPGNEALMIAVGMLGATVMPHVIYLHSELVQYRSKNSSRYEKLRYMKLEKLDIIAAMNIAFIINAAMVMVSAAVFYRNNIIVETISQAHGSLAPLLGSMSSTAFGVALLVSGLSSSVVGTMAGETIMKGFVNLNIPLNFRRLVTMAPALLIIALGINPMNALLVSQVVLSFILPFPIIQMLIISGRKKIMGDFANKRATSIIGIIIAFVIISLNLALVYFTF
mgnify:CR=1 FL=1